METEVNISQDPITSTSRKDGAEVRHNPSPVVLVTIPLGHARYSRLGVFRVPELSFNWRNRESSVGGECRVTEAANSLMSLLGCTDVDKMSRTLLAMSSSPTNCDMMRNSRCIPLLVQLLHLDPAMPDSPRPARQVRARAARALHNIVHAHPSDKHCKREAKVLKLLEVLRQYCDFLRDVMEASLGSSAGKLAVKTAGCRRLTIQVVEGGEKYAEQDLMVCGELLLCLLRAGSGIFRYLYRANRTG